MYSLWQALNVCASIYKTDTLRDRFLPLFFKVTGEVWVCMGRTRKHLWKLWVVCFACRAFFQFLSLLSFQICRV